MKTMGKHCFFPALALSVMALMPCGCSDEPAANTNNSKGAKATPAKSGSGGGSAGTLTVAEADPAVGEQHFNLNCSPCHQIGGTGLVGLAPSLRNRDFLALASDDFIRATVAGGRAGTAMVPRPDLSRDTVTHIIAYLRALEVPNKVGFTVDHSWKAKGDAKRGGAEFALYCAYCHGQNGEGYIAGGSGPGIGLPGFLNVASDDYIAQTVKHGRVGTPMRSFLGAKGLANLSEQDISDIIIWLRSKDKK